MKKQRHFAKLVALVGCVLLGAGVVLSGVGFVAMGCNLDTFTVPRGGEAKPEEVCYQEKAVSSIEVHAFVGNVRIEGSSSSQDVVVSVADTIYQAYAQNGLLMVMPRDRGLAESRGWTWYQLLKLYPQGDWDVTITVPENLLESVVVEGELGSITLANLQVGSVSVQSSSGDVKLENVTASGDVEVDQAQGALELTNCTGGNLTTENDLGDTKLADCAYQTGGITGSSGQIRVTDSQFESLQVENDLGDCAFKKVTVEGAVHCETGMGNVETDRFVSPDIVLTTDAGSVTGTIQGKQEEYQISVNTDLGNSNLQDQLTGGPYRLEVSTGMGEIDLEFTQ